MSDLTLSSALKTRIFRTKSDTSNTRKQVAVRNDLHQMFSKYLTLPGDKLRFHVDESIVPYVIEALHDPQINREYEVTQLEPTVFSVNLASIPVEGFDF